MSAEGAQLNVLDPTVATTYNGVGGIPEGRIAVVSSDIIADTTQPDEECVMNVQVWVRVRGRVMWNLLCCCACWRNMCSPHALAACSCTIRACKS